MRKTDQIVLRHKASGTEIQASGMPWPEQVDWDSTLVRENVSGMFKGAIAKASLSARK